MKTKHFILMAVVAMSMLFISCENNTVEANYTSIIVAPGESVQVKISGGNASINTSMTQWLHENDAIFSISEIKRHSIVVTGNNEGKDTLKLAYNQGIYANGEWLTIPVSVEK